MGLIGVIKPIFIHNFFKKKTRKRQLKIVIIAVLLSGSFFLELFFLFEPIWLKFLVAIGFIVLIKGLLMLNKKAGEKLSNYLSGLPLIVFRLIAVVFFIIGFIFWKVL
jgi:uncharacterized protein YjeT (DUF2065 family)